MNVLETMLRELDIRFSHSFVTEIYTNAPDSDNMYGLQRALSRYSIETVGVHYEDKDGAGVTFPCIFHLRNKFVVGIDLEDGIIRYHDGKGIKEKESDSFNEDWTGDALLVSDVRNVKEPGLFRNIATDIYKLSVRAQREFSVDSPPRLTKYHSTTERMSCKSVTFASWQRNISHSTTRH